MNLAGIPWLQKTAAVHRKRNHQPQVQFTDVSPKPSGLDPRGTFVLRTCLFAVATKASTMAFPKEYHSYLAPGLLSGCRKETVDYDNDDE
jgi:hypothetical protein